MKFWTEWRAKVQQRKAERKAQKAAQLLEQARIDKLHRDMAQCLLGRSHLKSSHVYELIQAHYQWETNIEEAIKLAFANDPRWHHIDDRTRDVIVERNAKAIFNGKLGPRWSADYDQVGLGLETRGWLRVAENIRSRTDALLEEVISQQIKDLQAA